MNILELTKSLVNKADIDSGNVRIGLATFDNEIHVHFTLDRYQSTFEVFEAIESAQFMSGARRYKNNALKIVRNRLLQARYGDRMDVPSHVIVITDGLQEESMSVFQREANKLKQSNVEISIVGIGVLRSDKLFEAASETDSRHQVVVSEFSNLERDVTNLIVPGDCQGIASIRVDRLGAVFVDILDSTYLTTHTALGNTRNCATSCFNHYLS